MNDSSAKWDALMEAYAHASVEDKALLWAIIHMVNLRESNPLWTLGMVIGQA